MRINVYEYPNSTWELDGDSFFCTHDEVEVLDYVTDHLGFQGHYQREHLGYFCAECEEPLEGSPEEDAYESMIDAQIAEAREYEHEQRD